jgi:hypothetical protein
MVLDLLRQQFTWVGIGLGLIGLLAIVRRRAWHFLVLTLVPYLTYIAFNLIYFIGDIYVLFIPSYLIFALWIGLGVWEIASRASTWLILMKGSPVPPMTWEKGYQSIVAGARVLTGAPIVALGFALPTVLLIGNFAAADRSEDWSAAQMWQPILAEPLPQGAALVSNDRDEIMPLWYYQYVDHTRPDLLGLFPLIVREPGYGDVGQVIDRALETGRPVFLIKDMPGLELKYRLERQGRLVRVADSLAARQPVHLLDLVLSDALRVIGYNQTPGRISPGDQVEIILFFKCVQSMGEEYSSYVHLVDPSGKPIAKHDHRPGGVYYPTTLWKPGEVLLDRHILSIPLGIAPGSYSIRIGLYAWPSMEQLGQEIAIGQVTL